MSGLVGKLGNVHGRHKKEAEPVFSLVSLDGAWSCCSHLDFIYLASRAVKNKFLLPLDAQCVVLCHGNPSKHVRVPTLSCLLKLSAAVTVY